MRTHSYLRNSIMKSLSQRDAQKIHDIIMASGNRKLIKKLKAALRDDAEARAGMFGMDMGWHATKLPESVVAALDKELGVKKLYERNVLSFDGSSIELRVLASALPEEVVSPYFSFNPLVRAMEAGIDFETFKGELRKAFKGSVGQPGKPDFGILLDAAVADQMDGLSEVTGLGMYMHPFDKATVDRISEKPDFEKNNLRDYFSIAVSQGQQVYDKGIDAKSVYIITPDRSPLAVKVMSEILNLPKA